MTTTTQTVSNISDTYQWVIHCNLPNVGDLIESNNIINLYDGKGNKLAYSFIQNKDENNDENIIKYFNNLYIAQIDNTNNPISSNTFNVYSTTPTTEFIVDSGLHLQTIPSDNYTLTGNSSLLTTTPSGNLIANVDYLNTSFQIANKKLDTATTNYINKRDWYKFVTFSGSSTTTTVNTGNECNTILVFASCNVLLGESMSRTLARSTTTITLKANSTIIDTQQHTLNCCRYWDTGNKSKSYYANWLQGFRNITLCGKYTAGTNKNIQISITSSDNPLQIYNPYMVCVRCKQ